MSTNDRIFFGQRWRDRWSAPFNAAAFERLARRYFPTRGWALFYLVISASMAVLMILGACAVFALAAKSPYLDAYGIEAPAKILHVSFHTDYYGRIKWKKLDYEFKTTTGDVVEGQLDRPVYELKNFPDGDHFTVLYWEAFPSINAPRGAKSNAGIITFIAVVVLLGGVTYSCLARRMLPWWKSLVAEPAG